MAESFPLGAAVTVAQLHDDPHAVLAELREHEPVSWLPALDGWLVTRHDLVVTALRDAVSFTVDDPRFSTSRVVGPSMLSLDGPEHARHRSPFVGPFRPREVRERFAAAVSDEAQRLAGELAAGEGGELRRGFAGPLAAATVARALGLDRDETATLLGWYDAIVGSVNGMSAGEPPTEAGARAYAALAARLTETIADDRAGASLLAAAAADAGLSTEQLCANAAILLFGGIETTEGMIANALAMLLTRPAELERARDSTRRARGRDRGVAASGAGLGRPGPLRRRPTPSWAASGSRAARSCACRSVRPTAIRPCSPIRTSMTSSRAARGNLAFAQGPHVCVGVHLARLQARAGLAALLDPAPPAAARSCRRARDQRAGVPQAAAAGLPVGLSICICSHPRSTQAQPRGSGAVGFTAREPTDPQEETMKLSARNQLTGTVTEITHGEAIANVVLDVSGQRIVASITVEAVRELGLEAGRQATVIVKASDVILAVD